MRERGAERREGAEASLEAGPIPEGPRGPGHDPDIEVCLGWVKVNSPRVVPLYSSCSCPFKEGVLGSKVGAAFQVHQSGGGTVRGDILLHGMVCLPGELAISENSNQKISW